MSFDSKRGPMTYLLSLSVLLTSSLFAYVLGQTTLGYSNMGPSSTSILADVNFFGSSRPISETTTAFDTAGNQGHILGYTSTNNGVSSNNFFDALNGYAYGSTESIPFTCSDFNMNMCIANQQYCTWALVEGGVEESCTTKVLANGVVRTPLIPLPPLFHAKFNLHAKGTVRTLYVDMDTRTRLGQMECLRDSAVVFFRRVFGLDFSFFNTFEGAQMIPFKWTDEMYLQIQNAFLPQNSDTIPERNRVLVDGYLVKPLSGEVVVLGGTYAASKGRQTVFLEANEVLIFYDYRVVDEYNRLYHTFRYYLKYPLATNRVGIAGWTATVVRLIPNPEGGCPIPDNSWGLGVDQGILELVNYDNLQDFAFTSVITFEGGNGGNITLDDVIAFNHWD